MEEENKGQDYGMENDRRVRAWVLVKAEHPDKLSEALGHEYRDTRDKDRIVEFGKGGGNLVVVRADVVDGEWNLVVPVDAVNEVILNGFVTKIQKNDFKNEKAKEIMKDEEDNTTLVLKVTLNGHNPNPPHRSSTFVTGTELAADKVPEYTPAGRHPHSPGRNAWG